MDGRDYVLPWKRGIGDDSRRIFDGNGRLVCTLVTSRDTSFLVDSVNETTRLRERMASLRERAERVQEGEDWDLAEFILREV